MLKLLRGSCLCSRKHVARPDPAKRFYSKAFAWTGGTRGSTGLYGYDVLKCASGFQAFAEEAIRKSEDLIERIRQMPPSMETISLFDELSDTVCTVVDSAELCRNTHSDSEFVEAASQASMTIYEYLNRLNTNSVLYDAIVKVENSNTLTTEEAKRAAFTHRLEFERGGVHLCNEKQEHIRKLRLQTTQLERKFMANILEDPGHIDIFPASRIPEGIKRMARQITKCEKGIIKQGLRLSTDSENLFSILKGVKDREIRRKAYMEGYSRPKENLAVLDELIAARDETAQIMGYESFADFNLVPTMAASPDVVHTFLLDLSEKIRDTADEELKVLEKYARQVEGALFKGLSPWDEAFYMCNMKGDSFGLDYKVVASYFPIQQCIEGLKLITRSLFGAVLKEVSLAPGESWHPDVQKFTLHHPAEGDIGHLYIDLYSRRGKYPGSAQFALKGGRRISYDKYQLPVVVVVCNFSRPSSSSLPVLNHWELETLFHEFGHALHSLLTRTDYQHFSGTRTVLDFVEIPSNLFETYAWDYRVLSRFAKHYSTGESIPLELVKAMKKAQDMFSATELQQQVLYALIDLTLFGKKSVPIKDTTSVVASLKSKHSSYKYVEGTHWHTRFNHLITYGAGYYSYIYARCIAANIWDMVCKEDPLSPDVGYTLRRKLLEHGGGKDPALIIRDCTNNESLITCSKGVRPSVQSLFKQLEK